MYRIRAIADFFVRCLSPPDELDNISADRSAEHTSRVLELFNQTQLGSKYGIIKQLVVSFTICKFSKANLLLAFH